MRSSAVSRSAFRAAGLAANGRPSGGPCEQVAQGFSLVFRKGAEQFVLGLTELGLKVRPGSNALRRSNDSSLAPVGGVLVGFDQACGDEIVEQVGHDGAVDAQP